MMRRLVLSTMTATLFAAGMHPALAQAPQALATSATSVAPVAAASGAPAAAATSVAPVAAASGAPAAAATSVAPVAAATASTPDAAQSALPPAASASYSAASLYNLANSYARAGKPGLAVLNYERASLLAPNDADIEANLHYVREGAHLTSIPKSAWQRAVTAASPTLLSFLGVVGVLLLGIALLAGERYPIHRWKRRTAALVGLILLGATAGNALVLWPTLHAAVIVTAATPVQVSPVPMGDQLFTLPEGETVSIAAEHEDFVLIQTNAGRRGWVARSNLVAVVPQHAGS